jgi:SAM-dependent methyltransferase
LPEPAFDLAYSVDDFPVGGGRDSQFLFRRIDEVMTAEVAAPGARTLDVACGVGKLASHLEERGTESWAIDPSSEMLGLSRWVFPQARIVLVRSIAENLPFADGTFDRVACQGSLDHFVDPKAFMREAARITKPSGRVVIALANYESLACRIGRRRDKNGSGANGERKYWEIPPDHNHRGDLSFVRRLGGDCLTLERCYGISMLWLVDKWDEWLGRMPRLAGISALKLLDSIARWAPGQADMIISVWRPRSGGGTA